MISQLTFATTNTHIICMYTDKIDVWCCQTSGWNRRVSNQNSIHSTIGWNFGYFKIITNPSIFIYEKESIEHENLLSFYHI